MLLRVGVSYGLSAIQSMSSLELIVRNRFFIHDNNRPLPGFKPLTSGIGMCHRASEVRSKWWVKKMRIPARKGRWNKKKVLGH